MIKGYFEDVPAEFFEVAGFLFVFCFIVLLVVKGIKKSIQYTTGIVLVEYSALLYCSTVVFRKTQVERKYDFQPLWTYSAIMDCKEQFVTEAIMNVIAFIPIGFLLSCAFHFMNWRRVLMIGCLMSFGIEALQLMYMKGFSEVDDVMHNTLGCMLGYGLCLFLRMGYEKISKRRLEVL